MHSLDDLNPEQRRAVEIVDRHLLVVAGAGSGKTRVLTHKIAHLIQNCGVQPDSILAVTFSNRAAGEMSERVRHLLSSRTQPRWVSTFHSACLRLLKEYASEAALPSHFTIYDETDQIAAIKRALVDLNLDPKRLPPQVIRYHIDRAKNETDRFQDRIQNRMVLTEAGLRVVARYTELLAAHHALDFGDILIRMLKLLRENEFVRDSARKRFSRILVDEYQDTNKVQKDLLREIAGPGGIVFAVGDEDQSIYSWRGARVENMLEFEEDFPGAAVVKLERNYRSTQKILTAANHIIVRNVGRREKVLWTENREGEAVTFYHAEDDYAEAAFVLDRLQELTRAGLPASQAAIFYRTNVQSRVFEDECRRRNLPYRIFGGVRFYDRAEIKDALAFLKLALNPHDNLAFMRIVNAPARGIGEKTLERLLHVARDRDTFMLTAIPFLEGNGKAEKALHHFHEWFTVFSHGVADRLPAEATEEVLERCGYLKALETEGTIEAESRLENLQELLRTMLEFSEQGGNSLAEYLDRISLVSDLDGYRAETDALTMMTVHNSKGLEFDAVFAVGMEEGIFPHHRSIEEGDGEDVEEERRLCYVAMTRARRKLTFTAAARRRLYQSTQYNPVSRFIGEIPPQHLIDVSHEAFGDREAIVLRSRSTWGLKSVKRPREPVDEYRQESYDDDAPARTVWAKALAKSQARLPFPPGSRVLHPQFGIGTVKKCEGKGTGIKLTVEFQRGGLKKLSLAHCSLERVDA